MNRTIFLIVGLCLCFLILRCYSKPFEKCPENFTLLGEKCYYIEIEHKQNWFESGSSCNKKESILAKIKNEAEMNELSKHFLSLETEDDFWISGDDKFVLGEEFDEMTYSNWADKEENDFRVNCVKLIRIHDKYLMVSSHVCTDQRIKFVCELADQKPEAETKQHEQPRNIKLSSKVDTGSEFTQTTTSELIKTTIRPKGEKLKPSEGTECANDFIKLNEKCYYVERGNKLNWYVAQRQCKRMGSEIITIENAKEMKDIANHLEDRRESLGFVGFWTGGNDLGSEGEFHWASTGEKVNYANWYENEPNNNSDNEHCLEISYMENDYYMNDHVCSREKFFICEAEPKKNSLPIPEIIGSCAELKLMRLNLEAESRLINLLHSQQQCPQNEP